MKILVINGPNLNMLGVREPKIYGNGNYDDLCDLIKVTAENLQIEVSIVQSNAEHVLIEHIQKAIGVYDGIMINAGAYTHTSIALLDALKAVNLPCVEVHISNIHQREEFRQTSYLSKACLAQISGCGWYSYVYGLHYLKEVLSEQPKNA